jgi:hypothetical protein
LDRDQDVVEPEIIRRSYPIDPIYHGLKKRDRKQITTCGYNIKSFIFPSTSDWGDHPPTKYGFSKHSSCDDYDWDSPDNDENVKYETEHVLEWQTVARFFEEMDREITTKFIHPDPRENKKIGFCQYWKESWTASTQPLMDGPPSNAAAAPNPANTPDPAATPGPQPRKRRPVEWLASQYPYRENREEMWLDEMTLLEKNINGINRRNVCTIPHND